MRPEFSKVRVGLKIPPQQISASDLRASWRFAEAAGFDHYWTLDRLAAVQTDSHEPIFEPWTLLAAAAEDTERIRLGVVVTANTFRHPGVLAKMVTTVDHLSGGRVEFGIGAGWQPLEHEMFDLPLGTAADRLQRLDESLSVIRRLWTESDVDFDGTYYRIRGAVAEPKPVQEPHPPIWVGAAGERLALRVVARHADVWNLIAGIGGVDSPDEARHKIDVLASHCAAAGRDLSSIRRSLSWYYGGATRRPLWRDFFPYLELGFTEIILNARPRRALADAEVLAASVLPTLRLIGAV